MVPALQTTNDAPYRVIWELDRAFRSILTALKDVPGESTDGQVSARCVFAGPRM